MASVPKPSSAHAHNARLVCHDPAIASNRSRQRGPLPAWPVAGCGPRPCASHARHGALGPGALRARAVAQLTVALRRSNLGKVYTVSFPSPRHTRLTRLRAPTHNEEGGRRRGKSHQRGRRRRCSTAVKVPVLRVGEQLWALVKL
jgi:hypothetical protein